MTSFRLHGGPRLSLVYTDTSVLGRTLALVMAVCLALLTPARASSCAANQTAIKDVNVAVCRGVSPDPIPCCRLLGKMQQVMLLTPLYNLSSANVRVITEDSVQNANCRQSFQDLLKTKNVTVDAINYCRETAPLFPLMDDLLKGNKCPNTSYSEIERLVNLGDLAVACNNAKACSVQDVTGEVGCVDKIASGSAAMVARGGVNVTLPIVRDCATVVALRLAQRSYPQVYRTLFKNCSDPSNDTIPFNNGGSGFNALAPTPQLIEITPPLGSSPQPSLPPSGLSSSPPPSLPPSNNNALPNITELGGNPPVSQSPPTVAASPPPSTPPSHKSGATQLLASTAMISLSVLCLHAL